MKKIIFFAAIVILILFSFLVYANSLTQQNESGLSLDSVSTFKPSAPLIEDEEQYFKELREYHKINKNSQEIIQIDLEPYKKTCYGPFKRKCLVMKNGQFFYENINGFEHEEGFQYKLKVNKIQKYDLDDAPQDVGLYVYELIEILEKTDIR